MDARHRKACVVGQSGRAVDADRCPPKPGTGRARRLQSHPSRMYAADRRVELGQTPTRRVGGVRPPAEECATGHRRGRHCRRPIAPSATGPCQAAVGTRRGVTPGHHCDGPARRPSRTGRRPMRDASLNKMGDQTAWPATQVDRRPVAQPDHGMVEPRVGVAAAEPAAHGQPVNTAVVVAEPTALTASARS